MLNWRPHLDQFLSTFEHTRDITGVLVCGSYVTGQPTSHSDLDVHIILDDAVDYRERGNRVIDGLLIEYFANPPRQIQAYFDGDLKDKSLMCQVQFATGEIVRDDDGAVRKLKEQALAMIDAFYQNNEASMPEKKKYFLWDMRDDLQNACENNWPEFDFIYFNLLDKVISNYLRCINRPYGLKAIYGHITSEITRGKYLLRELPDAEINGLIVRCILAIDRSEKASAFEGLVNAILDRFGGFDVNEFKQKSDVDIT